MKSNCQFFIRNNRAGALHDYVEEVASLSVTLDCAMTRKTPTYVKVEGNSFTRLTEILFAIVQSGIIPSLEN